MGIPEVWRNNSQRLQFKGEKCACGEKTFYSRDCCPGCEEVTFKPYIYKTVSTIKDKEELSGDGLPSKKVVVHPLMHGNDGRIHSKCVPGKEKYLKYPISATTSNFCLEKGNGKTEVQIEEMVLVEQTDLKRPSSGGNGKEINVSTLMEKTVEE